MDSTMNVICDFMVKNKKNTMVCKLKNNQDKEYFFNCLVFMDGMFYLQYKSKALISNSIQEEMFLLDNVTEIGIIKDKVYIPEVLFR